MSSTDAMGMVADLMAIAARTAPKARGSDFMVLKILQGEDLQQLAAAMKKYSQKPNKGSFERDGNCIGQSDAVLLVGLKNAAKAGLNCGACGSSTCTQLQDPHEGPEFAGPLCALRLIDLGIALGSAVKTAAMLNADNRLMYTAGVAARKIGIMDAEIIIAIPISATGKNIYFDR